MSRFLLNYEILHRPIVSGIHRVTHQHTFSATVSVILGILVIW